MSRLLASVLLSIGCSTASQIHAKEDSTTIYRNCNGLSDGSYFMRLIDDESYPVISVKCSNEYMILDYNYDNELSSYFNTWFDWHYGLSGPARYDSVNWNKWFSPDGGSQTFDYKTSISCNSCDMLTYEGDIEDEPVAYYMSTDTRMCMGEVAGYHGFYDHDWDTYQCYAALASELSKEASENPAIDKTYTVKKLDFNFKMDDLTDEDDNEWYVGFCGTIVGSSNYQDYNTRGYDECGESKSNFAPSIGTDGRFCVCAKTQDDDNTAETILSTNNEQVLAAKRRQTMKSIENNNDNDKEESQTTTTTYFLYQKDFVDGTYRIKKSGTYKIMEDITFDFNSNYESPNDVDSWMPDTSSDDILAEYPGAGDYSDPYSMGFFTGIAVEADNVVLDLNGYTIKQSDAFYFQQGFFSCIELANQIFLPGQPIFGFFGANFQSRSNIVIKNGVIGLSSHMGIHGNKVTNVKIENIHIKDFTTHGIQINGYKGLSINNVEIGPSSTQYWATTQYIHTRFLLSRFRQLSEMEGLTDIEMDFWSRDETVTMTDLIDEAEFGMNLAFNYYMNGLLKSEDEAYKLNKEMTDEYGDVWLEAKKNFIKDDGLPYGSALYGMFLNVDGASVQGYHWFDYDRTFSYDLELNNVNIHDLNYNGYESVTLRSSYGQYKSSFAGPFEAKTLFGLSKTSDLTSDMIGSGSSTAMEYVGSTYYDLIFALYHVTDGSYVHSDSTDLTEELQYAFRMVLFIPPEAMHWAMKTNDKHLYSNDDSVSNGYVCAHDNMFHPMKGISGIRLEGAKNVNMNNVKIENLYNFAELGSDVCDDTTNHLPIKTPFVRGYAGNNVHGIDVSYAKVQKMSNIEITNLHSQTGHVIGINLNPGSDVSFNSKINVNNLYAGSLNGEISIEAMSHEDNEFPNSAPQVCAIQDNGLTDDELETVNYKSVLPLYETSSMNLYTSCLSGKSGCIADAAENVNVIGSDDTTSCNFNIDLTSINENNDKMKHNFMLGAIINLSDTILTSDYGLYVMAMIAVTLTMMLVYCLLFVFGNRKDDNFKYQELMSQYQRQNYTRGYSYNTM